MKRLIAAVVLAATVVLSGCQSLWQAGNQAQWECVQHQRYRGDMVNNCGARPA